MERIKLRATHTNSVNSVDTNSLVNVQLQNSTRPMEFTDIRKTVNQYEQYVKERKENNKYRLITTIRPYCTNVLFNVLTEIVYKEGNLNQNDFDVVIEGRTAKNVDSNMVYGPTTPTRQQMVRNTEYSKSDVGYVYYPGYDIFNNHILRNKSFKIVNPTQNKRNKEVSFNTIEDKQRYPSGEVIEFSTRLSLKENLAIRDKHLYNAEDLYSYIDSINTNLTEENGWFGFVNGSLVDARVNDVQIEDHDSLYIGRVDNSKNRCEFIDMFPDRSLYSFCPKYNQYQHRLEKNWDLTITYPYKKDSDKELVKNGLRIASIEKISGVFGRDVLLVRTYTKHGLQSGDSIYLYYSVDGKEWSKLSTSVNVTATGNLRQEQPDYFFYITDLSLILEALGESYWYDNETGRWKVSDKQINMALDRLDVALRHLVNGFESEYYFRVFRKLPNFKSTPETLTPETGINKQDYIQFLDKNKVRCDFAHENYRLAFSNTIYGDDNAQFTFTDTLDTTNITDHLGRPLSELYITVIKRNKGYKEWYTNKQFNGKEIEFSRCFGAVQSGLQFELDEKQYASQTWLNKRYHFGDITTMDAGSIGLDNEDNITIDEDEFYGDVVELKPADASETILGIVYHRFNTAQREYGLYGENLVYEDITSDDYDLDGFKINSTEVRNTIIRPEGYYYQAHYRIPLKSFGEVTQGSHYELKIHDAKPHFIDSGVKVMITTRRRHHLAENDVVYICDDFNNQWVPCHVIRVLDKASFLIDPYEKNGKDENGNQMAIFGDWSKLCDILSNENESQRYKVRQRNKEIPSYAIKVGVNSFLWRPMYGVGDEESVGLEHYPFVNDHFYIHRPIEFYLRRQDPHGYNGLYAKFEVPNDVPGKTLPVNNYEHKKEGDMVC